MSKQDHDDEPTMDETLASIREIISDDDEEDQSPSKKRANTFEIIYGTVMVVIIVGLFGDWWPTSVFVVGIICGFVMSFLGIALGWWRWQDLSHSNGSGGGNGG